MSKTIDRNTVESTQWQAIRAKKATLKKLFFKQLLDLRLCQHDSGYMDGRS